MKELNLPWVNWHAQLGNSSKLHSIDALEKEMKEHDPKKVTLIAEVLEGEIMNANQNIVDTTIARIKAAEPVFRPQNTSQSRPYTIQDVLRPLFCETELQIEALPIPQAFGASPNLPMSVPTLPRARSRS